MISCSSRCLSPSPSSLHLCSCHRRGNILPLMKQMLDPLPGQELVAAKGFAEGFREASVAGSGTKGVKHGGFLVIRRVKSQWVGRRHRLETRRASGSWIRRPLRVPSNSTRFYEAPPRRRGRNSTKVSNETNQQSLPAPPSRPAPPGLQKESPIKYSKFITSELEMTWHERSIRLTTFRGRAAPPGL